MEILVLHPGALGDVILSLPALKALRRASGDPKITLAGNLDHLPFCAWHHADRVLSLSTIPLHRLYGDDLVPPRDAAWWRSFDRIVSWIGSDDAAFAARIASIHPAVTIARWRPRMSEARHAARLFLDSLGPPIPGHDRIEPPAIALPDRAVSEGREWLASRGWDGVTPPVALHPGASAKEKRWPAERFSAAIERLVRKAALLPLVIEGPAEAGLGAGLAQTLGAGQAILAESLPLSLLAAVLTHCAAYLGNDSGITHMAAALGVGTVALFGPTAPAQWAPLGIRVSVLCDRTGCLACKLGEARGHVCLGNIGVDAAAAELAGMIALREGAITRWRPDGA